MDKMHQDKAHIKEAAEGLLQESTKKANELYEEGMKKVQEAQAHAEEYAHDISEKVREKPLTSLLIAAGAGFILSSLLRK